MGELRLETYFKRKCDLREREDGSPGGRLPPRTLTYIPWGEGPGMDLVGRPRTYTVVRQVYIHAEVSPSHTHQPMHLIKAICTHRIQD